METIVILDSNLFIEGAITVMPSAPLGISSFNRHLNIKVFIPEGVRQEVIQKNTEKFEKNIRDVEKAAQTYRNEIDNRLEIELMKLGDFKIKFQSEFDSYLEENGIELLTFSKNLPPHTELFHMAVQKKPPFNNKGNNYRDAVMALSVQLFCEENSKIEVFFITKDKEFQKLIGELKVPNLKVCDEDDVQKTLESRIDKKRRSEVEEMKVNIREFVNKYQIQELEEYCSKHVKFDINKFGVLRDEIVAIKKLNDLTVKAVEDFEIIADESKSFHVTLVVVGTLNVDAETSQASKNAFMEAVRRITKTPKKIGDIKGQRPGVWEELHRQQTGYYDNFIESRDILIGLDIKAEIESLETGEKRANFLAVNHSDRDLLRYVAID